MKNYLKKISILILLVLLIYMFFSFDALATGQYINPTSFKDEAPSKVEKMTNKFSQTVIYVIRIVGTSVAVALLLIIGMKYMIAAPGEKADLKKYAINYVIAATLFFGATSVISIIYNFSKEIKK